MLAGALASASNVVVFQAIYFSGVAAGFLWMMIGLAFVSGAVFGGYLAWDIERLLVSSRILRPTAAARRPRPAPRWRRAPSCRSSLRSLPAESTTTSTSTIRSPRPGQASVSGAVSAPYTFSYRDWTQVGATVRAELRGSVTYVPPADYTGVPSRARSRTRRTGCRRRPRSPGGGDGYEATLPLGGRGTGNADILLTRDGTLSGSSRRDTTEHSGWSR